MKSSTKYLGVSWDAEKQRWRCLFEYQGERIRLGRFRTEIDAAKAFDAKAKELGLPHLNFPDGENVNPMLETKKTRVDNIDCKCGGRYQKRSLRAHERTKKHQDYIKSRSAPITRYDFPVIPEPCFLFRLDDIHEALHWNCNEDQDVVGLYSDYPISPYIFRMVWSQIKANEENYQDEIDEDSRYARVEDEEYQDETDEQYVRMLQSIQEDEGEPEMEDEYQEEQEYQHLMDS